MRFSTGQLRDFFEGKPSGVKSEHLKGTKNKINVELRSKGHGRA